MFARRSTSERSRDELGARRRKRILTWFMAIIMVSSIFGFIIANQTGGPVDDDYRGFGVERSNMGYKIKLDKTRSIASFNHPLSVESVKVDMGVWDLLNKTRVMGVVYNQSDERAEVFGAAQFILEKDLLVAPKIYVQRGLFNASDTNLQTMSCSDASPAFPVMVLEVGDETKVYLDGWCVHVQGFSAADILRASDKVILGLAGVVDRD